VSQLRLRDFPPASVVFKFPMFKKYSQMKLAMKREALEKLNHLANEMTVDEAQSVPTGRRFGTVMEQS
jgi:hypothetical protein